VTACRATSRSIVHELDKNVIFGSKNCRTVEFVDRITPLRSGIGDIRWQREPSPSI